MGEGGRGERAKNSPEVKIRIKSIIVYQEQCSISRFVVHLYKIMISPHLHAFFSFSKFWFFGLVGGGGWRVKGQKWSKMTKKLSVALHISGIIHYMTVIYGTHLL